MNLSNEKYDKMVKKASPNSPVILDCIRAFIIGGLICSFGQLLTTMFEALKMNPDEIRITVSVTLICIAAFLTAVGLFDKIAKFAGAGTLVPITGFANSVVAPAVEFKSEGFVMGTGANIFRVSGPVIAYGILTATVFGLIYYIMEQVM